MRAPIVGGSELETATITRMFGADRHLIVYPARFAAWQPDIRSRFGIGTEFIPSEDIEATLRTLDCDLVHIQFPFLCATRPVGHDTVLELRELPPRPTVFTVHAAVNIPVVEDIHYVFHTADLAERFASKIPAAQRSVCPSPVELPKSVPDRTDATEVSVLWVSRNDDGKFHPDLGTMCALVLDKLPHVSFRFIGRPTSFHLPDHPRIKVEPCPAADLDREYRQANVFWHYPHPLVEETWCRTVTEAMGYGLPCVVAKHGAMRVQVEHGRSGFVVDSVAACADAIVELAQSAPMRSEFGRVARSRARSMLGLATSVLQDVYSAVALRAAPRPIPPRNHASN